ncbi:hypothetical protein L0P55_06365, partial [Parabacteroides merdae]|nr:hypothetical protein [Parabacteroides merdae]
IIPGSYLKDVGRLMCFLSVVEEVVDIMGMLLVPEEAIQRLSKKIRLDGKMVMLYLSHQVRLFQL